MSKLGKKPINIPKDTKVKIESGKLILTGPKGSKELTLNDKIFTTSLSDSNNLIINLIKKKSKQTKKTISIKEAELLIEEQQQRSHKHFKGQESKTLKKTVKSPKKTKKIREK